MNHKPASAGASKSRPEVSSATRIAEGRLLDVIKGTLDDPFY